MTPQLLWDSFRAEAFKLRHRRAVWVSTVILVVLLAGLDYLLIYALFKNPPPNMNLQGATPAQFIAVLYPNHFVRQALGSISSIGAPIALILGVLCSGSEYGWNTLRTVFTQRPGRLTVTLARALALAGLSLGLAVVTMVTVAASSAMVGALDGKLAAWPSAGAVASGLLAAWLIMLMWATLGMVLGVAMRQSAMAIGAGLVYSIAIEGLIFAVLGQVSFMADVEKVFPGANATALVQSFGSSLAATATKPLVGTTQAVLVLAAYVVLFVVVSGVLTRQRDIID